jgi:REP element-mobilizing transposase RayT
LVRVFRRSLARACERPGFRVVHFSLQSNHLHLLVEARSERELGCGMKAVGSRLARAANRVFRRRGSVLAERYHSRALTTPREVRDALAYVLLNARKHWAERVGRQVVARRAARLDPASSAAWFDGWVGMTPRPPPGPSGIAPPGTWLMAIGWRRRGRIDPREIPGR